MSTVGISADGRSVVSPRRGFTRRAHRALAGYLFISPWIIGFLVFVAGPMLVSLYLSFTRYNLLRPPEWTGITNYRLMFDGTDPLFVGTVKRTLYYAIVSVILSLGGSLACALLLNTKIRGTNLFRTAFFIPSLTPVVAAAILWRWILQPKYGPMNGLLSIFGIEGPAWLQSTRWSIPSIILIRFWRVVGGGTMIVFLAGLQAIPQEMYDAAHVDGASAWQRFRHVTLPLLTPTIFFNLIVGTINALQVFALAYIASGGSVGTEGGPAYSTWFYILHLYNSAFSYLQMGYASALAWVFFIAVLILTLIQFAGSRNWVYYESA